MEKFSALKVLKINAMQSRMIFSSPVTNCDGIIFCSNLDLLFITDISSTLKGNYYFCKANKFPHTLLILMNK